VNNTGTKNAKEVGTAVTITDILCSPYVQTSISHALRTKCCILLPHMFLKSPGFIRSWNKMSLKLLYSARMIYPLYTGL